MTRASSDTAERRPPPRPLDLLAGGVTLTLGAFFLVFSLDIPHDASTLGGPHLVPRTTAAALVLLGLAILAVAWRKPGGPRESAPQGADAAGRQRPSRLVFVLLGGGFAYVALIGAVGYLLATLIAAPFAFAGFGNRGVRGAVIPGLLAAVLIYLIFFRLLGIYDPPGALLDFSRLSGR